eukprot:2681344-Pyramimonas_sp.AAC.1
MIAIEGAASVAARSCMTPRHSRNALAHIASLEAAGPIRAPRFSAQSTMGMEAHLGTRLDMKL